MATKLRKWTAYRKLERPYTRFSKYRKKAFVKARPGKKIIKFDMGNLVQGENFPIKLQLISKDDAQVRTNSIEAARIAVLRRIEKKFGRSGFYFRIKAVPHHTLRENPLAAGAGADRLSTGMKHSFGKTIGTACQVMKGKVIFELYLPNGEESFGREALKVGSSKLTLRTTTQSTIQKVKKLTAEELEYAAELQRKDAEQKVADAAAAALKEEKKAEDSSEDKV